MIQTNEEDITVIKNEQGLEQLYFDPYNPLNVEITPDDVYHLLRKYGIDIHIKNFNLFRRAFIHRSYTRRPDKENKENSIIIANCPRNCLDLHTKSNERLEFLGDGVLECVTKYCLYKRFPKENEGFMTEKKIALVKNESIGKLAYEMGLHKWYIMSKHSEAKQTRINHKKLGCLFEAFLGALFLDANKIDVSDENCWQSAFITGPGFQIAQQFIENVYEKHVDWISLVKNDDNYKNILQVTIQKEFKVTPYYREISEYHNENGYHMGVYLCLGQTFHNSKHFQATSIDRIESFADIHNIMAKETQAFIILGQGIHKIKKKAEQIACKEALDNINKFV
jgi:dsRNA-specific ribonuclease